MLEIQAPYFHCPPPIPTHHLLPCSLLFICRFLCFMPLIQGSWDFVLARTVNDLQILNQSVFVCLHRGGYGVPKSMFPSKGVSKT